MQRVRGAIVLAAVVALAGCNGGSEKATTTTSVAPASTTTSVAPATTAVLDTATMPLDGPLPPVIDLVYAQRTMDALAQLDLQAALEIRSARTETPKFVALVKAASQSVARQGSLDYYRAELASGFKDWQPSPSAPPVKVRRILSQAQGSRACLIIESTTDLSTIDREFTSNDPQIVQLTERSDESDPGHLNPTRFQTLAVGSLAENSSIQCP